VRPGIGAAPGGIRNLRRGLPGQLAESSLRPAPPAVHGGDDPRRIRRIPAGRHQHYVKDQRASKDEASAKVDAHVSGKVGQYIAMDKAGKLDAYIESCPQPEDPN
jgi:hypothetical protein